MHLWLGGGALFSLTPSASLPATPPPRPRARARSVSATADLWKHGNDSEINIRILKPSYLYPYNAHGFGDHIKVSARPIIVHGTKKAGKMIKGEAEIRLADSSICFDVNVNKDKIGTYGCHPTESKGGSQGFIWSDRRIRVSERVSRSHPIHPSIPGCIWHLTICSSSGCTGA